MCRAPDLPAIRSCSVGGIPDAGIRATFWRHRTSTQAGTCRRPSRPARSSISPASAFSSATPRVASAGSARSTSPRAASSRRRKSRPGTEGLGTGFLNVIGPGSTLRLTGGARSTSSTSASWGTGVVTVANGGLIACASVAACAFTAIGNGAGSTGTLAINGGCGQRGWGHSRSAQGTLSRASARRAPIRLCDALDHERRRSSRPRASTQSRTTVAKLDKSPAT